MSSKSVFRHSKTGWIILAVLVLAGSYLAWQQLAESGPGAGFVSGNGRIEATEFDISAKLPGRIEEILVAEGEFVKGGQVLVRMQSDTLLAQRDEAEAVLHQAHTAVAAAQAQLALRNSDELAARAMIAQREAELDAAKRRLQRSQTLSAQGAASMQELDDDRARMRGAEAVLAASRAQADAATAAIRAAEAQVTGAEAAVKAAMATVARVEADLRDNELKSPRDGRVQFRVSQPGEVIGAGGRVLNVIDLSDVYLTFFLPSELAGRIALGSEVRIVLDTAPHFPLPASVSFVSSVAQFTPKSVETASERQKLMFRIRARIPQELLHQYLDQVKSGLPGVAWVKLDPDAIWPAELSGPLTD